MWGWGQWEELGAEWEGSRSEVGEGKGATLASSWVEPEKPGWSRCRSGETLLEPGVELGSALKARERLELAVQEEEGPR